MATNIYCTISLETSDKNRMCFVAELLSPEGKKVIKQTEPQDVGKDLTSLKESLTRQLVQEGWKRYPGYVDALTRFNSESSDNEEYEYCEVTAEITGYQKGAFRKKGLTKATAYNLTPTSVAVIAETVPTIGPAIEDYESIYQQLVNDGWKHIEGEEGCFCRAVTSSADSEISHTLGPSERLQKIAELRDANLITEEDYESKKSSILAEL